jgi:hypothetical protein
MVRVVLLSWLNGKAVLYVLVAVLVYCVGAMFNLIPAPIRGLVSWGDENTDALIFLVCFVLGCYVVLKLRKKGE